MFRNPGYARALSLIPLLTVISLTVPAADTAQARSNAAPPSVPVRRAPAAAESELHPTLRHRLATENAPVKAWVFFTDKGSASPAALDAALRQVAATYNPRAVQRRLLRGAHAGHREALFDEHDLPVAAAYVEAVTATGARRHVTSNWLNAVSVWGTPAQLAQIAALPFVDRLEAVARARRNFPVEVRDAGNGPFAPERDTRSLDYGAATAQLTQINVMALHDMGYTGAGVIVGILDTGFRHTHEAFTNVSHPLHVIAEYDFVNGDPNAGVDPGDPPSQHEHGTMILGCIGAYNPGRLVGGAYDAAFILCKTEDTSQEVPAEEDNYVAGLEFIEAHGGDMATASLGYIDWYTQAQLDGHTAVTTIAVNLATARGVHCCNAAGNEGHDSNPGTSHLIAPADALQVITCGAVNSSGATASFSSDGPTADGRVKPELLARGIDTWTVSPLYDHSYATASGTSLSTPLVACAVACLIQARPAWTVDQMRDNLLYTADYYLASHRADPFYVRGYGIVNAAAPLQDCNHNGVPDVTDIANGTSQDCAGNGIPDECEPDCNHNSVADSCDIAQGTSSDCTGNGIPDECEQDCNHNGVADSCDITRGTSSDCNSNGVPDECDIANGTSWDMNGNGTPDECESDCNGNGVPDGVDIATGTSRDCNHNGVPDECELTAVEPLVTQWPDAGAGSAVAQDFGDVGYPGYSTKAWDDFTVGEDVSLATGQAFFTADDWASFGAINFLVEIASAPGGAEAGAPVVLWTSGTGTAGSGTVSWDFHGATLPAGTWWLSVQAMGGFGSYGQFYWLRANDSQPRGSEHFLHNPGGAFKHGGGPVPGSIWYTRSADLAFDLNRVVTRDCNGNGTLDMCEADPRPTIQSQPASLTVYAADALAFAVVARGTPPLRYQWQKDAADIPGATGASYTLPSVRPEDAGDYNVVVRTPCGSVTSATATLTVKAVRPPGEPSAPYPADGAVDVPLAVELGWAPADRAAIYRLLIRMDPTQPFEFKGNTQSNRWAYGANLLEGTTYYWQVLAKNDGGTTPGPIWSFTTVRLSAPGSEAGSTPAPEAPSVAPPDDTTLEQPSGAGSALEQPGRATGICPAAGAGLLALTFVGLWRTRAPVRRAHRTN